jgi:hypothetical protein
MALLWVGDDNDNEEATMPKVYAPVDPECPDVKTIFSEKAPGWLEQFFRSWSGRQWTERHRERCDRCLRYGAEHMEAE